MEIALWQWTSRARLLLQKQGSMPPFHTRPFTPLIPANETLRIQRTPHGGCNANETEARSGDRGYRVVAWLLSGSRRGADDYGFNIGCCYRSFRKRSAGSRSNREKPGHRPVADDAHGSGRQFPCAQPAYRSVSGDNPKGRVQNAHQGIARVGRGPKAVAGSHAG